MCQVSLVVKYIMNQCLIIIVCYKSELLHIRLVLTLQLSTTCINQCNIRDELALNCVTGNILKICNLKMALRTK